MRVGEGPKDRAMLTEFCSAFVSCLVRDALDFGLVQSKITQFTVRKRAQFAQRVAVDLAAGGFGAIFRDHHVHARHDAITNCAETVCFVCHVPALFEFECFRSLETKIGKCCVCTMGF